MLNLSFGVLTAACGLGAWLAARVMRENAPRANWRLPAMHGALGALGVLVLVLALRRGAPRGLAQGVGAFGWDAAVLLGAALVAGLGVLLGRGRYGLVLALHVVLAMFGYTILLTYVSFN